MFIKEVIQTIVIIAPHAVKVFKYLAGISDDKPVVLLAGKPEMRTKVALMRKKNEKPNSNL